MNGWVLYDGDCGMCTALARRLAPLMASRDYAFATLQEDWVRTRLGLSEVELMSEMRVLSPEGKIRGGVDSIVFLAGKFWWAWPLFLLTFLPGVKPVLWMGYRWIAANRGCSHGGCRRP